MARFGLLKPRGLVTEFPPIPPKAEADGHAAAPKTTKLVVGLQKHTKLPRTTPQPPGSPTSTSERDRRSSK